MTNTAKPSELLPAHKVLLERIERLKHWSDNGCHMKIHGPSAGEAYELALELESMLASRPPPSEQAGDWPELPEAFDSVLVDDFTNLSIPVFAEWQMRAYGEVCRASRPAAVDVPNRFISDGLYSVADVYIRRPAKPCDAEGLDSLVELFDEVYEREWDRAADETDAQGDGPCEHSLGDDDWGQIWEGNLNFCPICGKPVVAKTGEVSAARIVGDREVGGDGNGGEL